MTALTLNFTDPIALEVRKHRLKFELLHQTRCAKECLKAVHQHKQQAPIVLSFKNQMKRQMY